MVIIIVHKPNRLYVLTIIKFFCYNSKVEFDDTISNFILIPTIVYNDYNGMSYHIKSSKLTHTH